MSVDNTHTFVESAVAPPFDGYATQRARCPVAHDQDYGGFWSLYRYADVAAAALDTGTFSSTGDIFIEFRGFPKMIPINLDPPDHGPVRAVLNRYFMPKQISAIEPAISRFVNEHVDEFIAARGGDIAQLALVLPQRALVTLLNMPEDSYRTLLVKRQRMSEVLDDPVKTNELMQNLWTDEVVALVHARRTEPLDPATDLMTGIMAAEFDGKRLSDADCISVGLMMFAAGGDTTTSAITNTLFFIATRPDIQEKLRADPKLIKAAVEEFLRLRPPLHSLARTTAKAVEVGGCPIPAESRVSLNFGSANRDESVFPNPNACQIDRKANRHLSFGYGPHICLGAPLARLELRLVLERVLAGTRWMTLDGQPEEMRSANSASGFSALRIKFDV